VNRILLVVRMMAMCRLKQGQARRVAVHEQLQEDVMGQGWHLALVMHVPRVSRRVGSLYGMRSPFRLDRSPS